MTALPEGLDGLALEGWVGTLDALSGQTELAEHSMEQPAEYVLAVKGQPATLAQARTDGLSGFAHTHGPAVVHDYHNPVNKDPARLEIRAGGGVPNPSL